MAKWESKTYRKKKVMGVKNPKQISERTAWSVIMQEKGLTDDMLDRTEHTETHWVFVCKRPAGYLNVVQGPKYE